MAVRLPESIRVLERGWLSSNNILLRGDEGCVLIDSGYHSHSAQTLALVQHALQGQALALLVNTHIHSDHIGGNAALQAAFGVPILVPLAHHDAVAQWDEAALLLSIARQKSPPFRHQGVVHPGDRMQWGGMEWHALAVPGHDMGALAFHNPELRVLISGDALWEDGFGIVFPELLDQPGLGLAAQRQTLEMLARLPVDVVIPGHGAPFTSVDVALTRAWRRLEAFEAEPARVARNAIRGCFTFALIELRHMPLGDVPLYLEQVELYRLANARYLGLSPGALAEWLVRELTRAGVARCEGDRLLAG